MTESQKIESSEYYAQRAAQERARALTATDPSARAIHKDMAARYDALSPAQDVAP